MDTLRNKKCLITGAGSGIGRATALRAGAEGAELVLTDLNPEQLTSTIREVRAAGGKLLFERALDVSDYEAVRAFATDVHAQTGSLDVVMNVAGISIWGAVENLQHHHWKRLVDVNLMGPIHIIECFIPEMIRRGKGGHLVNVSSAAGPFGLPWHAAYSASKFGLRGVSEVLRFDLEPHGIGVSLVCPGAVDTGLVETLQIVGLNRTPEEMKRYRAGFRKHAVRPEQAAAAIVRGVLRNEYLVFTSQDIRVGHFIQRTLGFVYERRMRRMNQLLNRVARVSPGGQQLAIGPSA